MSKSGCREWEVGEEKGSDEEQEEYKRILK